MNEKEREILGIYNQLYNSLIDEILIVCIFNVIFLNRKKIFSLLFI